MILLAALIVYPLYLACLVGLFILIAPLYLLAWAIEEYDFRRNW